MKREMIALLLILSIMPVMAESDYQLREIATLEGSIEYVVGNATIIPIQNFEYLPGWLLYVEYTFHTNASSYFTEINYASTLQFKTQMGTLIQRMVRVELVNESFHNELTELSLTGINMFPTYLSMEIIPDTSKTTLIQLDYRIIIFDANDQQILDETEFYSGEISHFPSSLQFTNSYIGSRDDAIYLVMPEFMAQNESRLPDDYHYIMDVIINFDTVGIDEGTDLIFSIPPFTTESKIEIVEDGEYQVTLHNMDNRAVQKLMVYHDGADMQLNIRSVSIDIPALIDVPEELITPLSFKISSGIVSLLLFFLSYKIVDSYGKRQIRNKMEDLI